MTRNETLQEPAEYGCPESRCQGCLFDENYPPEQLRVILEAAPPAETLDGYTLAFKIPKDGDSVFRDTGWAVAGGCWTRKQLVRTPIAPPLKYLINDEITDEHAKRRPPCEYGVSKSRGTLVYVDESKSPRRFLCRAPHGTVGSWENCCIKESDTLNPNEPS